MGIPTRFVSPKSKSEILETDFQMSLLHSFDPILPPKPRLLILGSMPGKLSLEMRQYYAHPRNQFWKIMGELLGFSCRIPYEQRVENLARAGIALWDVLQSCERDGSLDQAILPETETPNPLDRLILAQPSLSGIAFNGGKSRQAFRYHIHPKLPKARLESLHLMPMPSTSPANARYSYPQKLAAWSQILDHLRDP